MKLLLLLITLSLFCACSHSDDEYRTVPVTNNPTLIPSNHLAERPGFVY